MATERPLGTDPSIAELQRDVAELLEVTKRAECVEYVARDACHTSVEPCKECATWEKRRDNAEQAADAWRHSSEENLTLLALEKQKNATIQSELVEVRDHLEKLRDHVTDMIGEAERDDGVEVPTTEHPEGKGRGSMTPEEATHHTELPWSESMATKFPAHGGALLLYVRSLSHTSRILSEANYHFARHRVNCHDELLAMCKATRGWFDGTRIGFSHGTMKEKLDAIIGKAEATS